MCASIATHINIVMLYRMDFSDWLNNFTSASVCRVVNTSFFSLSKTWHEASFHGAWGGNLAGGCSNNRDTFLHNPQVLFILINVHLLVLVQRYCYTEIVLIAVIYIPVVLLRDKATNYQVESCNLCESH